MVHVLKNHIIKFLMQLYASKYIHFLYIITFLDSLLEGFPTLKKIVSLNIGLKCIISDYNQGHIIQELRTRGSQPIMYAQKSPRSLFVILIRGLPHYNDWGLVMWTIVPETFLSKCLHLITLPMVMYHTTGSLEPKPRSMR
jgi:hypothetical protein